VVGGIRGRKHHGDSLLMRNKRNYNGKMRGGFWCLDATSIGRVKISLIF